VVGLLLVSYHLQYSFVLILLTADDMSTYNRNEDDVCVAGVNSILPKEHGNKFYNLPIIRQLHKDVSAVAAWDSSIHDSVHLNKLTDRKLKS